MSQMQHSFHTDNIDDGESQVFHFNPTDDYNLDDMNRISAGLYPMKSEPKKATNIPGLVPINIHDNVDFYLGLRNPENKKYEGHRLFYNIKSTDFALTKHNEIYSKD